MSARVLDTLLPQLRHEPTRKRLRATLADEVVIDSTQAILVWEPQRILPAYAAPHEHIRGELLPAHCTAAPAGPHGFQLTDGQTVLDPSVPFAVHTTDGQAPHRTPNHKPLSQPPNLNLPRRQTQCTTPHDGCCRQR